MSKPSRFSHVALLVAFAFWSCCSACRSDVAFSEVSPGGREKVQIVAVSAGTATTRIASHALVWTDGSRQSTIHRFNGDFTPGVSAAVWLDNDLVQVLVCNRWSWTPTLLCFNSKSGLLVESGCPISALKFKVRRMFPGVEFPEEHFAAGVCRSSEAALRWHPNNGQ